MTDLLNEIANETAKPRARKTREEIEDLERLREQERLAAAAGFSMKEPMYALGTRVNSLGVENAKLVQQEFSEKPSWPEARDALAKRVRAEERRDVTVAAGILRIDPVTGRLHREGQAREGLEMTEKGFSQLFQMLPHSPSHAGAYLASVPPDRRAREFTNIVRQPVNRDHEVVLRLRKPTPGGGYVHYATVSDRYEDFGPMRLIDAIDKGVALSGMADSLRCEVAYRGEQTRIKLFSVSEVAPERFCAGEVFQAGASFTIGDDKSHGISGIAQVIRNLCLNLICLDEAGVQLFNKRHRGLGKNGETAEEIATAIREALVDKVKPFVELWSKRRGEAVEDVMAKARALSGAVDGGPKARKASARVAVPGVKPQTMLDWIMESYAKEPEPTVTGIANAIARVPQVGSFSDPHEAQEILAAASNDVLLRGLN